MANVIPLTPDSGGDWERPIPNSKTRADTEAGPMSLGLELCRARQRSGKTLTDVSNETKIPTHHLMAMERNRFELLPGRVYAVGFIRSYADCVGLDSEPLVARIKADMPDPDEAMLAEYRPKRQDAKSETAGTSGAEERAAALLSPRERKWPQAAAVVVLIVGVIYSGYSVLNYAS